jgi:hypothetical protein
MNIPEILAEKSIDISCMFARIREFTIIHVFKILNVHLAMWAVGVKTGKTDAGHP